MDLDNIQRKYGLPAPLPVVQNGKFATRFPLNLEHRGDDVFQFGGKYIGEIENIYDLLYKILTNQEIDASLALPYAIKITEDKLYIRDKTNSEWILIFDITKPNFPKEIELYELIYKAITHQVIGEDTSYPGQFKIEENILYVRDKDNLTWTQIGDVTKEFLGATEATQAILEQVNDILTEVQELKTELNRQIATTNETLTTALQAANEAMTSAQSINIRTFNSVEEMKASNTLKAGALAKTLGFYTAGDGGGANYLVDDTIAEDEADGASIIALQNGLYAKLLVQDYINVKWFGAKGDGATDDTEAIQKACDLNLPVFIPEGTYIVKSTINITNNLKSLGVIKTTEKQGYNIITINPDNNLNIERNNVETDIPYGSNIAYPAIGIYANGKENESVRVINNNIKNSTWGILVTAESGEGNFFNTIAIGNSVLTDDDKFTSDGLHIVGACENTVIVGNAVTGRNDAGIAHNMIGTHNGGCFSITGNASKDNFVGIDLSGTKHGVVSGNCCINNKEYVGSAPAIRAITYNNSKAEDLLISGNIALNNNSGNTDKDIKIVNEAPFKSLDTENHVAIIGNVLKTFYTNAGYVTLDGNIFRPNAQIVIDPYSNNIIIGRNNFESAFDFNIATNEGLLKNIFIAKQNWNKADANNFLPNYNKMYAFNNKTKLETERITVLNAPQSVSSSSSTVIANAIFYSPTPFILDNIVAIGDLSSHAGYIEMLKDGETVAKEEVYCNPGSGGTNVVGTLNYPKNNSSFVYKPRLEAGLYTFKFYALIGTFTLKYLGLDIWN